MAWPLPVKNARVARLTIARVDAAPYCFTITQETMMDARELQEKGITIVKVPPSIATAQCSTANEFKDICLTYVEKGARNLILDLSGVAMLPSAVLGHIIVLHKRLCENNGRLVMFGATGFVKKAFDVTRLDRMIPVCASEEEAIETILGDQSARK